MPGAIGRPGLESCPQCWKNNRGDAGTLAVKAKGQRVRSREVQVLLHLFP